MNLIHLLIGLLLYDDFSVSWIKCWRISNIESRIIVISIIIKLQCFTCPLFMIVYFPNNWFGVSSCNILFLLWLFYLSYGHLLLLYRLFIPDFLYFWHWSGPYSFYDYVSLKVLCNKSLFPFCHFPRHETSFSSIYNSYKFIDENKKFFFLSSLFGFELLLLPKKYRPQSFEKVMSRSLIYKARDPVYDIRDSIDELRRWRRVFGMC